MASSTAAAINERRTIYLEHGAPAKSPAGATCNGCGVCCQYEPCPLGVVLSLRRSGACVASVWDPNRRQYRCAALVDPRSLLRSRLPAAFQGACGPAAWLLSRFAPRWIAAGVGCDCDLEILDATADDTLSAGQLQRVITPGAP